MSSNANCNSACHYLSLFLFIVIVMLGSMAVHVVVCLVSMKTDLFCVHPNVCFLMFFLSVSFIFIYWYGTSSSSFGPADAAETPVLSPDLQVSC